MSVAEKAGWAAIPVWVGTAIDIEAGVSAWWVWALFAVAVVVTAYAIPRSVRRAARGPEEQV